MGSLFQRVHIRQGRASSCALSARDYGRCHNVCRCSVRGVCYSGTTTPPPFWAHCLVSQPPLQGGPKGHRAAFGADQRASRHESLLLESFHFVEFARGQGLRFTQTAR